MAEENYDNPETLERWCAQQRVQVANYLRSQQVKHGRIGEWPAWEIAPHVSIWAVESLAQPEWIGWWAISGDVPTDYISSAEVGPPQHPRKALRVIANCWIQQAEAWQAGRDYEGIRIAGPHSRQEMAPQLESRARLLLEWVENDSLWPE